MDTCTAEFERLAQTVGDGWVPGQGQVGSAWVGIMGGVIGAAFWLAAERIAARAHAQGAAAAPELSPASTRADVELDCIE